MTPEEFEQFVRSPDPLERHLRAAAAITELAAPLGLKPVVVGGSALEFYTRGSYLTMDIDLIVEGLREIQSVLERLGFEKVGGASFHHDKAMVVVDLPPEPLHGDPQRVVEVDVGGRTAYIIGLEDILADRLRAAAYWRDESSKEWAVQLLAAYWDHLDWSYLGELKEAEQPAFAEVLASCSALAQEIRNR
ncbi:MAG: UbiD family decarboxylase [Firmicutes bacterium]|nr:UbiD family decarboxylase [Bacillota bacterium]